MHNDLLKDDYQISDNMKFAILKNTKIMINYNYSYHLI